MDAKRHGAARVIVHLDLDCFYAQVEHRRLKIPQEEPLAVQQWGALLAINYPARKLGIGRGDNVTDARKKCPTIHLPHVETMGENRKPGSAYDRSHQKAILRRYRVASKEIFEILGRFAPLCYRGSIDEAYLDVTAQVNARMRNMDVLSSDFCRDPIHQDTKVVGIHALDDVGKNIELDTFTGFPLTEVERLLCVGASFAREIRQTIMDELGFTCSVGVATNKLLAKLASPLNKPNGQVILAPRFLTPFMQHFPLRKVQGFGGKLGRQLIDLYHQLKGEATSTAVLQAPASAGEATTEEKPPVTMSAFMETCSLDTLVKHFGRETAIYIQGICIGDDGDAPVESGKADIKSFMAAKQYDEKSRLENVEQMLYWLPILAEEVIERCEEEKAENKRFPCSATVNFTRVGDKTKSRCFPIALDATIESVVKAAMSSLQRDFEKMFPCSSMSISVKEFMSVDSRIASISTFFVKPSSDATTDHRFFQEVDRPVAVTSNAVRVSSSPSKKRKITAFFGTAMHTDDSISNIDTESSEMRKEDLEAEDKTFFCEKCDHFVYTSRQEHADFHFALQLSRSASTTPVSSTTSLATPPSTASPALKKKPRQGPLDAFLSR